MHRIRVREALIISARKNSMPKFVVYPCAAAWHFQLPNGRSLDEHQAAYVKDKPVSLPDFTATCLAARDIPPETRISADGFTVRASAGEPISALFG
ncbi:MAG: hypothetical protein RIS70_4388 [Planctomycetota bacterium]